MPMDATGQYRHNHESANMHSEQAGKKYNPDGKEEEGGGGEHTEVHNHGDGTFHTVHGGEQTEHESIGHMHAHLSKIHGEEGSFALPRTPRWSDAHVALGQVGRGA